MKKFTLLFNLLLLFLFSCGNSKYRSLAPNDFEKEIVSAQNVQLIDVRTPDEFQINHLKGAVNIDWLADGFENEVKKLNSSYPTFVYCLSGKRSDEAAEKLVQLGFTNVIALDGGLRAWLNNSKTLDFQVPQKELSVQEYQKQISTHPLVLVDFNAPWCGPCRQLSPIIEEIEKEKKDSLFVLKLNTDIHQKVSNELKISGIPALILYKNGNMVWRNEGLMSKEELLQVLNSFR